MDSLADPGRAAGPSLLALCSNPSPEQREGRAWAPSRCASAARLTALVGTLSFLAHGLVSPLHWAFDPVPLFFHWVVDAALSTLLFAPALYVWSYVPLARQIRGARAANAALRREAGSRLAADRALEQERNRLAEILAAISHGICIVRSDHQVEYANPAAERAFGAVGGRRCYEYFHDRAGPCPQCQAGRVFGGEHVEWEWLSEKTGRTYRIADAPIRSADGLPAKLEVFCDVTDRRERERALAQNEAKYRMLLEEASDAIGVFESSGRILDVNAEACRKLGYARDEMLALTVQDLLVPEELLENPLRLGDLPAGEASVSERRFRTRDGNVLEAEVSTRRMADSTFQVIVRDVTARKRRDAELRRSREQLRELSVSLQRAREAERMAVAREIHDEFGQSLTALKLNLAWVARAVPEDNRAFAERARQMDALIDRTIRCVQELCSALRPAILDDLGLSAALEWLVGEFERQAAIPCALDNQLGCSRLDGEVSTALFRVLQEALTNVARHAGATEVEVVARETDAVVELEIRDNGVGAAEERLAGPRALGVAGIRERILALGGHAEVSCLPEGGTRVRVSVPKGLAA